MKFYTIEPKSAEQFINRLSDVEKIRIRMAQNADRLDHLRQNEFASDFITQETMLEVHARLLKQFSAHPVTGGF